MCSSRSARRRTAAPTRARVALRRTRRTRSARSIPIRARTHAPASASLPCRFLPSRAQPDPSHPRPLSSENIYCYLLPCSHRCAAGPRGPYLSLYAYIKGVPLSRKCIPALLCNRCAGARGRARHRAGVGEAHRRTRRPNDGLHQAGARLSGLHRLHADGTGTPKPLQHLSRTAAAAAAAPATNL